MVRTPAVVRTFTVEPIEYDAPACNTINAIIRETVLAKARAYDLWLFQNPAILWRLIWPEEYQDNG